MFWVHAVCFYTLFVSNARQFLQQTTSADDISDAFFLGALRVKFSLALIDCDLGGFFFVPLQYVHLSYDVASGSEITL